MAYTKQTWVDGTTPIDAEHMNHIEDGIEAASSGQSAQMFLSVDEPIADIDAVYDASENGIIIVGLHTVREDDSVLYTDVSYSTGISRQNGVIRFYFIGYNSDTNKYGTATYSYNTYTNLWTEYFIPFS